MRNEFLARILGSVLHIQLRHIAAWHPHVGRMRKRRERKLRPIRPSRRNELWYREQLGMIVGHLRAAGAAIAQELRPHWMQSNDGIPERMRQDPILSDAFREPEIRVADETVPGLAAALQRAAAKFGNIEAVAKRIAAIAARKNLGDVDDRLVAAIKASVGIDIRSVLGIEAPGTENTRKLQAAMTEATVANVDLITSLPAEYLDQVGDVITEAWQSGTRWESLVSEISERGDVAESRAALIARDQTSKMNASFNEVRQTSLGIEKYIWSTSQDERVRDSHAELDGQTFPWDSPPIVDGEAVNPGEAINCRCVALPLVDLDAAPEGESAGQPELEQEQEAEAA